jgi:hypothetical protein
MESRWSDLPHWRPMLDRARGAVETLARDMQEAEGRGVRVCPPPDDAAALARPAPKSKRRQRRKKVKE